MKHLFFTAQVGYFSRGLGIAIFVLLFHGSAVADRSECGRYEMDMRDAQPAVVEAARFHLAKCKWHAHKKKSAIKLFKEVLQEPILGDQISVIYEVTWYLLKENQLDWLLKVLEKKGFLKQSPKVLETKDRERMAATFYWLWRNQEKDRPQFAQIKRALYVDLAETEAATFAYGQGLFVDWQNDRSLERELPRARVLTEKNRNEAVIETLGFATHDENLPKNDLCESRYLLTKAWRRLHRYEDAFAMARMVAQKCEDPVARDALFIAARLAVINITKDSWPIFDGFLSKYPEHSYADDVMLWKARALQDEKEGAKAEAVLAEQIKKYPTGDMVYDAWFLRVLLAMQANESARAIGLLRQMLNQNLPDEARQQAQYWLGRLLLYPNPIKFEKTKNAALASEGIGRLKELAKLQAAGFYGHLARQVLRQAGHSVEAPKRVLSLQPLECDQAWQRAIGFGDWVGVARRLAAKGYEAEAVMVVGQKPQQLTNEDDILLASRIGQCLNWPEKAYQLIRLKGLAGQIPPTGEINGRWTQIYPRPYENEVKRAAANARIPNNLLFALIREESAFDEQAVSWAGALGLTQLMLKQGQSVAAFMGLANLDRDQFLSAPHNTLVGAQNLATHIRQLGHPILAIAAYNAGLDNVQKWLKNGLADKPIDFFVESIPYSETRQYAKRVANSWAIYSFLYDRNESFSFSLMANQ